MPMETYRKERKGRSKEEVQKIQNVIAKEVVVKVKKMQKEKGERIAWKMSDPREEDMKIVPIMLEIKEGSEMKVQKIYGRTGG